MSEKFTRLEAENQVLRTWVTARVITLWEAVQTHGERTSRTMQSVLSTVSNDAVRHQDLVSNLKETFLFLGIPPPPIVSEYPVPASSASIPNIPPPPIHLSGNAPTDDPHPSPTPVIQSPLAGDPVDGGLAQPTNGPPTLPPPPVDSRARSADVQSLPIATPTPPPAQGDSGSDMDEGLDDIPSSHKGDAAVGIPDLGQLAGPAGEPVLSGSGLPALPPIVLTAAPSRSFSCAPSNPPAATTRTRGALKRGLSAIPEQADAPATKKPKHT